MTTKSTLLLNEGNIFLINQDYEAAELSFTNAIELLGNGYPKKDHLEQECAPSVFPSQLFRALSHRSAARLSISSKTADALTDAQLALCLLKQINSSNDTTDLIPGEVSMAHGRSGMALYKLEEYAEAKDAFSYAVKLGIGSSAVDWSNWILRCEEMAKELEGRPKKSAPAVALSPHVLPPPANVDGVSKKSLPPICPKYQYYQNDSVLTIAILQPNVQSQDVNVDISIDKLTVLLKKDGVEFTVIYGTLFDAVDVSKCKVKVTDEKVLIKLRKKNKHEWHELFGSGARDKGNGVDPKDGPSIIKKNDEDDKLDEKKKSTEQIPRIDQRKSSSRPYASHKDWNAIERNLKEEEENEKPQGDEALNKLFKEIYGKGDEATRRAMIKSYQTSGGTVLSTNWNEVSNKDYENEDRECPGGMEWKNWEGKKLPNKD